MPVFSTIESACQALRQTEDPQTRAPAARAALNKPD